MTLENISMKECCRPCRGRSCNLLITSRTYPTEPPRLASVQEKKFNIDFQHGSCGGHLGNQNRAISAIFDLQIALILPTKFWVSWPFGSGEEAQNKFSRWLSWISNQTNVSSFCSTSWYFLPSFKVNESFSSGEEAQNRFARWQPSWISDWDYFGYFWFAGHHDTSYLILIDCVGV